MFSRLFILLRSFFLSVGTHPPSADQQPPPVPPVPPVPLPSFLSILLIILRSGSMYLESCFSFSMYCWSSRDAGPAGLMTELGLPVAQVSKGEQAQPRSGLGSPVRCQHLEC